MEAELTTVEKLLNSLVPFAQQQLDKQGEFLPFAGMLTKNNEAHLGVAGDSDKEGVAFVQESIDKIVIAHRKEAEKGNLLASAICFDVKVAKEGDEKKQDAICVAIEEENGMSVNLFIPYKKSIFGKIKYGELFGSPKESNIFNTQ